MMTKKKPTDKEIQETQNWGTWSKEKSEFPWFYDSTETCYILEGKATVTDKEGNSLSFEAGDMVTFEQGLECEWNITEAIKKKYMFS